MPRHPVPKTNFHSTTCKRCKWFHTKTECKQHQRVLDKQSYGWCTYFARELYEKVVPAGMIPCSQYVYEPCSGSGNTYAIFNPITMNLSYITPILAEARIMLERYKKNYGSDRLIIVRLDKIT